VDGQQKLTFVNDFKTTSFCKVTVEGSSQVLTASLDQAAYTDQEITREQF
jgi:hypothetical protein